MPELSPALKDAARAAVAKMSELNLAQSAIEKEETLDFLTLQEAMDFCALDGVEATYDELYMAKNKGKTTPATDAVKAAQEAIGLGFERCESSEKITQGDMVAIFAALNAGDAKALENDENLAILETFLSAEDEAHPLVKIASAQYFILRNAVFGAASARMAQILTLLFLVQKRLLVLPILGFAAFVRVRRRRYDEILSADFERDEASERAEGMVAYAQSSNLDEEAKNLAAFVDYALGAFTQAAALTVRLVQNRVEAAAAAKPKDPLANINIE